MSNDRTCDSCFYWGYGGEGKSRQEYPLRQCGCPIFQYGYDVDAALIPDNGVLIENEEGWGMITGPKFGCVHWKQKQ